MPAENQDLLLNQGADESFAFDCTDAEAGGDFAFDGSVTDVIWNMSGASTDTTPLVQKDLADGITIPTPADTAGLAGGFYYHELWAIKGGKQYPLARGEVELRATVEG